MITAERKALRAASVARMAAARNAIKAEQKKVQATANAIERWERKLKRAENALKKLRRRHSAQMRRRAAVSLNEAPTP